MNVRGYHWNIAGPQFFELHAKFEEETYNDLLTKVDELAERILTLGSQPRSRFQRLSETADIKEHTNVTDDKGTLRGLLDGYSVLLQQQRELLTVAADAGDEGTASLMSDYIKEQEKQVWMLNAYLGK